MVTREQAKEQLKTLGVENPTDEQITTYLNNVNSEANKEKARADKYKADADKAKELEEKVAELENQNLTDAEKQQKENEALQKQIKDLTENNLKIEAKAILAKAGMDDESIEALLPGMIADTLENTQSRANAYVSAMNKSIENAIKEGVDTFIEFGNGKVLAGLNRKISSDIKTYNVSDIESIESIKKELLAEV